MHAYQTKLLFDSQKTDRHAAVLGANLWRYPGRTPKALPAVESHSMRILGQFRSVIVAHPMHSENLFRPAFNGEHNICLLLSQGLFQFIRRV